MKLSAATMLAIKRLAGQDPSYVASHKRALVSPLERYESALEREDFSADSEQRAVAVLFDGLHDRLRAGRAPSQGWLGRLTGRRRRVDPLPGVYLWGGVGRGKTFLMDAFFESLPFEQKQRLHFHWFMQQVHAALHQLRGRPDPLKRVAEDWSQRARVICLDEMQVNDITDAMLMAGLLDALFARGVTLVTTSNTPPDGLYRAGLQRDRFLPAIGLLQQHCQVIELASAADYRLRQLEQAEVYHCPLDDAADLALARTFEAFSGLSKASASPLCINGREIPTRRWCDGVVWFDFDVVCHIPRSKLDYVEVARDFQTVLISNLRALDDGRANIAQRLITLVDACYDRNVNLIASAEVPPAELYRDRNLAFAFERCKSRLIEMQSHAYLERPHLA